MLPLLHLIACCNLNPEDELAAEDLGRLRERLRAGIRIGDLDLGSVLTRATGREPRRSRPESRSSRRPRVFGKRLVSRTAVDFAAVAFARITPIIFSCGLLRGNIDRVGFVIMYRPRDALASGRLL